MPAIRVQGKTGTLGSAISLNVTFDATTASGNAILVFSGTFDPSTSHTVTDNKGNSYTNDGSASTPSQKGQNNSAPNITGGATHQVTLTAGTSTGLAISMEEVSGLETSGIKDKGAAANGNTDSGPNPWSTGLMAETTVDDCYLFAGLYINNTPACTFDSPWTKNADFTTPGGDRIATGALVVSITGAYGASGTISQTFENWLAVVCAYKVISASGKKGRFNNNQRTKFPKPKLRKAA